MGIERQDVGDILVGAHDHQASVLPVDPARAEQARSAGLTVLKNNQGALGRLLQGIGALLG